MSTVNQLGLEGVATLPRAVTVLVVDDEPSALAYMTAVLSGAGFDVLPAANGTEALAIWNTFRGRTVAALVSDIDMPLLCGSDLARRLWLARPDLPVVYVSGGLGNAAVEQDVRQGRALFLSKPFLPGALLAAIRFSERRTTQ